jgi:hypothetical protein
MGLHAPERQAEHRAFATRQPAHLPLRAQTGRSIPAAADVNKQLILSKMICKKCRARKREEIVGRRPTITKRYLNLKKGNIAVNELVCKDI